MRALRMLILRHRRQWLLDELGAIQGPKGTIAYARQKLAEALHTERDRERRIGAIDREMARLEAPRTIIERALAR